VVESCEHINESFGPIKGGVFLDQLSDWLSTPWSWLLVCLFPYFFLIFVFWNVTDM